MQNVLPLSNGATIKQLRQAAGMTQDKLGVMSNIDRRTVQRAEHGAQLQMETLSSIAAALSVPVTQIVVDRSTEMDSDDLKSKSLVVLNRIRSGITLLNIVRDSYQGSITCDADPTPQNVDAMTAVVGKLEEIMQQPWARPGDQLELSLSERLRAAVTIGEHLKHLESEAVGFFAGTYTARTQVPRYDNEEGEMYITGRTPFELVTMFRVVIAPAGSGDRLTVKANDIYVPPKAPAFESGDDLQAQADKLDEDIPF